MWNPYLVCDIESLEKVQRFAACLKNWSASHDQLYNQSNVSPLSARRILMQVSATRSSWSATWLSIRIPLSIRVIQYNSRHSHVHGNNCEIFTAGQLNSSILSFPGLLLCGIPCSLPHYVLSSPSLPCYKSRLPLITLLVLLYFPILTLYYIQLIRACIY